MAMKGKDLIKCMQLFKIIQELAEKTTEGFVPFIVADPAFHAGSVLYDDTCTVYSEDNTQAIYPIVMDACMGQGHNDVISTYDEAIEGVEIKAVCTCGPEPDDWKPENGCWCIVISFDDCEEVIHVCDGDWEVIDD